MPKELILPRKPEVHEALKVLGLNANPFHADPDPTEPPLTFADFRDIWNILQDKISTIISRGYNQRLMIFGPYGSGKSHILRFLHNKIGASYSHEINRGVSFYCTVPQNRSFSELYASFIRSISKEKIVFLFNIPPKIKVEDTELRNALQCLGKGDSKDETAWRWLSALPTYSNERSQIGVTTKLEKNDQACVNMLISIVKMLLEKGLKIIFIGIDELERLRTWSAEERRSTQNLLEYFRLLIDSFPGRVFFALAGTDEFERVFDQYGAFSSRFSKNEKCYLKTFGERNMSEFKLFIFEYLDIGHIERTEFIKKFSNIQFEDEIATINKTELEQAKVTDSNDLEYLQSWQNSSNEILLYPFTSDTLKSVLELSQGLPRKIIQMCNLLIEKTIDKLASMAKMPEAYPITYETVQSIKDFISPPTE